MKLTVHLKDASYPIFIERQAIEKINQVINTERKIALIADSGVPDQWIEIVKKQCQQAHVFRFEQGEESKCFSQYEKLLNCLIEYQFTRSDAIIAIGGGVTGDLAGFVAATYMRGIDFYNIPTTLLSQVDSSVGGKVAIDVGSYKNIVGAFWQPKAVIIDPNVLSTLPKRHIHNGLVEALKTGLIQDPELVSLFEEDELNLDEIIYRSINVKRQVVEKDEKESNLRKILNFGHTIGHAIESAYGLNTYLHGECVAMGMLFFIEDQALKERILKIYQRLELPEIPDYDTKVLMDYIVHDKKSHSTCTTIIKVNKIGSYQLEELSFQELESLLERGPHEK